MKQYPPTWSEIRKTILRRAGGQQHDPRIGAKCEQCGIQNYAVGWRDESGRFHHAVGNIYYNNLQYAGSYQEAREVADSRNEWSDGEKYIVIVLTIAHVHDENPQNVDENNLLALCQACHNRLDAPRRRQRRGLKQQQLQQCLL